MQGCYVTIFLISTKPRREFTCNFTRNNLLISIENLIADFDFADDIATVTDSIAENTRLCQSISDIAAEHGLLINIEKTKYMFYNIPWRVSLDERVFVNGEALEEVSDFKYLGSYIASTSRDIHIRKGPAWKALQSLDTFWKSNMSRKIKTKIFRIAVEPVLLYGAET